MGLCLSCKASNAALKDKSEITCSDIDPPRFLTISEEYANGVTVTKVPAETNTAMANSFNNMNFTNSIKELVSKNRTRYIQDGFNLDLTYITNQIIAMGYPASSIEGVYRNHIDDVVRMLESKHKDHYKIYNLCSERSYDTTKFHNRVKVFPFDDHNPPRIELIEPFCEDVHEWLTKDDRNVAVVHCKAGKGRTGTMICCYLLHSRLYDVAEDALNYYGTIRTQDKKGVTIPSQVRYVQYYSRIVREGLNYTPVSLYIYEIVLEPPPNFPGVQGGVCFSISQNVKSKESSHRSGKCSKLYKVKSQVFEVKRGVTNMSMMLDFCLPITGDIKVELYSKSKISKVKQFQFWFNTFFVAAAHGNGYIDQNGGVNNAADGTLVLTINKSELDIVNKKDKQNKTFSSDFKITLHLNKIPGGSEIPWATQGDESPVAQDSHSGSSEGDSSDEDEDGSEWDSVVESENMDPRGVGYRLLSECELASQLTASQHEQHAELLAA